jgi:hypothetical protein
LPSFFFSLQKEALIIPDDKDFRIAVRASHPGLTTLKLKVNVLKNDYIQTEQFARLEDEATLQVRILSFSPFLVIGNYNKGFFSFEFKIQILSQILAKSR